MLCKSLNYRRDRHTGALKLDAISSAVSRIQHVAEFALYFRRLATTCRPRPGHFFAFSPRATSRRMACALVSVLSDDDAIQESIAAISLACQRSPTCKPRPVVAGRPRFFFVVTETDFTISLGYHKTGPEGKLLRSQSREPY